MVLSERERRLLQEMETELLREDPGLASSMSVRHLPLGVSAVLTVVGLTVGIMLMAVGVLRGQALGIAVALVGYVVLLASTTVAMEWLRKRGDRGPLLRPARRAA